MGVRRRFSILTSLKRIFARIKEQFAVASDAEVTVECAPGTLTPTLIETLLACGVNRVSLGVQSFVDQEAQAVGRLHKRVRQYSKKSGDCDQRDLTNINVDLIAGLPHQTAESWRVSSQASAVATGVPHVSVYMLEVDEDSRLGRELIAGGTRYHAHFVPDEEATADFYLASLRHVERVRASRNTRFQISRAPDSSRATT